jgi:hypothetical protein
VRRNRTGRISSDLGEIVSESDEAFQERRSRELTRGHSRSEENGISTSKGMRSEALSEGANQTSGGKRIRTVVGRVKSGASAQVSGFTEGSAEFEETTKQKKQTQFTAKMNSGSDEMKANATELEDIVVPDTSNELVKDFAAQLRRVAELNSSVSSIGVVSHGGNGEEEEQELELRAHDDRGADEVDDLNDSDDLRGYSTRQQRMVDREMHSQTRGFTDKSRARFSALSRTEFEKLKSRAERFGYDLSDFPTDLYDDLFTPGSQRREEYLNTSHLSHLREANSNLYTSGFYVFDEYLFLESPTDYQWSKAD